MADIDGTSGNDSLNGTSGADTINGGGGNDTIVGGASNDAIYGDNNNLSAQPTDTTDTAILNNFQVISLGTAGFDIDPTETGGTSGFSENGGLLNGSSFGSTGDPLSDNVVDLFAGSGNGDGQYDGDQNVSSDTFWINGTQYTFDGAAIYNNTLVTFEDGTTAFVSAVVFQDTAGNLYLAPETTNNADTAIYTSQPITSIQLGTQDTSGATGNGLTAWRVADSWVESSEVVIGPAGDDSIDGGDGNDTILGEGGNDSIAGGAGDDTIYGDSTETQVIGDDFSNGAWSGSATLDSTRATFDADNQWTNALTLTPTGMSSGSGAGGGAQITLDVVWSDGPNPATSGSAELYIDYGGVNYVRITTPNDGTEATIEYFNGASGPAGPIPEGDALAGTGFTTLTIDLPPGVADSGELEFWANTTGGGTDNFAIDNVIVSRDGHITTPGNDTIDGGDGSDVIDGGDGDDRLDGGTGNDTVIGGTGSDTILLNDGYGGDSITGGEDAGNTDIDVLDASGVTSAGVTVNVTNEAGTISDGTSTANFSEIESFTLTGQDDSLIAFGNSSLIVDAGAGSDAIQEGNGNNTLSGGDDSDVFFAGYGVSTITGGEGGTDNDMLSFERANDKVDVTFNGTESGVYFDSDGDSGTFTEIEQVFGTTGNDTIDATLDNSTGLYLDGWDGDDIIIGGSGSDDLVGGAGSDNLSGGAGADLITGDAGTDVIDGGTGADTIFGGTENDTIDGGADNDLISGDTGNDSLTGGLGNDTFSYSVGDGLDTITDFNTGNTGALGDGDSTNNDFIDLSGFYDGMGELRDDFDDDGVLNQSNATTNGGTVDYSNNDQFAAGEGVAFQNANRSSFSADNTGVVCFAAGTLILTDRGEVPVERLRAEDRIVTYDNGLQPLAMLASRRLGPEELSRNPALRPIEIKPGALGAEQRLVVSPQHMMLVLHDGEETLVRARQLSRLKGGTVRVMNGCRKVTYFHLIFDAHQIVFANNRPAESFFPGPRALAALDRDARREFKMLFPDIKAEPIGPRIPRGWNTARNGIRTSLLPNAITGVSSPMLYSAHSEKTGTVSHQDRQVEWR